MSKEEEEQLQLRIKELIDKISSKEKEITNNSNFLKRSGAQNRVDIIEKRNTIYDKINSLAVEINTLKQKMRGDRGLTDDLRDQLDQLDKRVVSLQESKNKILVKLDDFRSLRNSLSNDREKLDKTREANFILSSIDFGRCPRCLQEITAEMKKREDDSNCMLCGRELIIKESDIRILDRKNLVEEEIKETDILLEKYQADLKTLDIELDKYIKGKTVLQNELDSQSSSYVSPFVDELERLLHERNSHNAQVELLEQQLRLWQSLEESEIELSELRIEQRKLQTALAELDTRDDEKIRRLSEYYESFLRGSQFPKLISARISPETLMPLVNGHAYTEDTGIGFISVKVIGFHFSLLRFSLDIPCYYPRFLIMDSPRQFDINPETYKSMLLQLFGVEKKRKKSDFQLILTTRDLPEDLEPYVIERLNSNNRMLLREEGQREQSSAPW